MLVVAGVVTSTTIFKTVIPAHAGTHNPRAESAVHATQQIVLCLRAG
jgi:hypothetical protein